jgi:hypothetical protein
MYFLLVTRSFRIPLCTIRSAIQIATFFVSIACSALAQGGESRPAFCEPVPDALLGGLQAPYARKVTPDGDVYCEGLLRNPIALPPTTVVSVKQYQSGAFRFTPGKIASLTWCDDAREAVHVRLRSMKSPTFALDAMQKGKLDWRSDLISKWQPDWTNISALAIREIAIEGRNYKVLVPLRNGQGYSSSYSFVVQSKTPLHLTLALIEPIVPPDQPRPVSVTFASGPTKDTWTAMLPFAKMNDGVYRITFEEGIDEAGNTTEPIYLLHKVCGDR